MRHDILALSFAVLGATAAHAQSPDTAPGLSGTLPILATTRTAPEGEVPGVSLAYEEPQAPADPTGGYRAWGQYLFTTARLGADRNGSAVRSTSDGLSVGIERSVLPELTLGASFGYAQGRSTSTGVRSDNESYAGSAYLWWNPVNGLEIDALAGATGVSADVRRLVTVGGVPTVLNGRTGGLGVTAYGAVGYRFRFDTGLGAAYLKPFASLSYGEQDRDAYVERTASGTSGLAFAGRGFERSLLNLGAAAGVALPMGNGWTAYPEVSLAWSRHLIDPSPSVLVTDIATGAAYALRDPRPGTDGLLVSSELTLLEGTAFQVFAGYTGEFRGNLTAHQARVGLRSAW